MKSTTLAVIIGGITGLALIAAATVLLALHDLSESTAIALYTAAGALVTGDAKALLALKVPAPPQTVVPPAPPAA
jgi:hypothetical protein